LEQLAIRARYSGFTPNSSTLEPPAIPKAYRIEPPDFPSLPERIFHH
jgi:hypothetical protein